MPATTLDYATICNSVKKLDPAGKYSPAAFAYNTGFINNGFMGAVYVNEDDHEVVICFKGTGSAKLTEAHLEGGDDRMNHTLVGDLTADLKLMLGVIPNQASTAQSMFKKVTAAWSPATYAYSICGHSLGGYLAQVVSYWYALPCVTFNAPGAWGDIQKAKINLFKPEVAWRSIKSTFQKEEVCVNFIHTGDVIGNYGLHRGRTFRVAGVSHAMKAVLDTISKHKRWADCSPFDTRSGIAGLWDRF